MTNTIIVNENIVTVVSAATQGPAGPVGPSGPAFVAEDRVIESGTSDSATTDDGWLGWNSVATAPKFQIIPTSSGSKQVIIIKDVSYTAGTYPITIAAESGNIDQFASIDIATPGGSIMLLDTIIGWSIIG